MAIIDFPAGLVPLLEDATGCFPQEQVVRSQAAGRRGTAQVIRHDNPGRWQQQASFHLDFHQYLEVEAVVGLLDGGVHQLRAPDFYQLADRHRQGWPGQAPLGTDGKFAPDGYGLRAEAPPTLVIDGDHAAGARSVAVRGADQRHVLIRKGERISIGGRLDYLRADLNVGTGSVGTLSLWRGLMAPASNGEPIETAHPTGLWEILNYQRTFQARNRRLVTLDLVEDLRS